MSFGNFERFSIGVANSSRIPMVFTLGFPIASWSSRLEESELSKVPSASGLDLVPASVTRGCSVAGPPVDVAVTIPDDVPASCDVSSAEDIVASSGCSGDIFHSSGIDDASS